MRYTINTDGGARGNPGPAASGAVIKIENTNQEVEITNYLGINTNNFAEYMGVILALSWITEHEINKAESELSFYLDSQLVVKQLTGEYKIKEPSLQGLAQRVKTLERQFKSVNYTYIPRALNAKADKLVNICLDEN